MCLSMRLEEAREDRHRWKTSLDKDTSYSQQPERSNILPCQAEAARQVDLHAILNRKTSLDVKITI